MSCRSREGLHGRLAGADNFDFIVVVLRESFHASQSSSFFKCGPTKFLKHVPNTRPTPVPPQDPPCGSSLDSLEGFDIFGLVWVPDSTGVLQDRPDKGFVR